MSATSTLIQQTEAAFQKAGWEFRVVDDKAVLESEFEAQHAKVSLHVQAFDELGVLAVVAKLSFAIAPGSRNAVNEALMRTNLILNIGNFEACPDSGDVFFRATNIFPDAGADSAVIASLVRAAVVEIDRITPFLAELQRDPGQAVPALLAREDLLPDTSDQYPLV